MSLIAAALLAGLAQEDTGEQFYKFPKGTRWTYAAVQGERQSTRVVTLLGIEAGVARLESRETFENGEKEKLEALEWTLSEGRLEWSTVKEDRKTPRFQPWKAGARKDDTWKSEAPEAEYAHQGTVLCRVAAGTYASAVRVHGKGAMGDLELHLVPGLGLVRLDVRNEGRSLASLELASFSLGGAVALDLSGKYNARLDKTWHPETNLSGDSDNDLGELPSGHQVFAGTSFNAAGIVQLASPQVNRNGPKYPDKVEGLSVGRECARLHFLHGAGWSAEEGTVVGKYLVNYADGTRKEIPIAYGEDLRDWWFYPDEPLKASKSVVAWTGKNKATAAQNMSVRLFKSTWTNPDPKQVIKSIDYVSTMTDCAPFLVAVTADPAEK